MPDNFGGPATGDSPESRMLALSCGQLPAQAVYVFARLGVADLLREGDKSSNELAQLTLSDSRALGRLMRYLETIGVVEALDDCRYSLTPLGRTLCSGPLGAIRDNALLMSSPAYWGAIGNLFNAVKTGDNAFRGAHGRAFFEYLENHPTDAATFNAAMNSSSGIGHSSILSAYDFSGADVIADLAGGQGRFLEGVLKRHPKARGILFDTSTVVSQTALDPSVGDRVTKVPGSLFDGVPEGADIYVLRRVLHNWNDAQAIEILRRCREACHARSKLLIIEAAPPEGNMPANNWAGMDMLMMILMDGCERTAADFEQLFGFARLRLSGTFRTRSSLWIVEAAPA